MPQVIHEETVVEVPVLETQKAVTEVPKPKVQQVSKQFGQVDSVDINHLPDKTSRGVAFVKFADMKSVDKVIEAQSSHRGAVELTTQNNTEKDQVANAAVQHNRWQALAADEEESEEDMSIAKVI